MEARLSTILDEMISVSHGFVADRFDRTMIKATIDHSFALSDLMPA